MNARHNTKLDILVVIILEVKSEIGFLILSPVVYDINIGFKLTSISFNRDLKVISPMAYHGTSTINFGFKFDFYRYRQGLGNFWPQVIHPPLRRASFDRL